ncbi:hypothetical protein ACFWMR_37315 [Amycolatopsis thailandensis]|uniref:hypothetical protein n=1 Tax=Amycolatopsis thailandensis TaxID=589330 RepID=UPI0036598837
MCGAVVHSGQVSFQNGRTVRAEDRVGEEAADGVQELVFADPDRGGQIGVWVGTAAVVLLGPASSVTGAMSSTVVTLSITAALAGAANVAPVALLALPVAGSFLSP